MRILLALFSIFLLGSASAQELLAQERWPDGTLKATRYSEGERIHFITYHENGRVKEMGTFRRGKRDGEWKQFTDTGALVARAGFRNGERQGSWEFRSTTDAPLGRLVYSNGMLVKGEAFTADGGLLAQREY